MTHHAMIPPTFSGPEENIPPSPTTNQIAGFVEYCQLTHNEQINRTYCTEPVKQNTLAHYRVVSES